MAEPHERPDGIEAIAFQILLQKVTALEQAVQSLPPLLKKIIDHLEAQAKQQDVPMATYEQLYAKYLEAPEADDEAEPVASGIDVTVSPAHETRPRRRVWHWFLKETS